MQVIQRTGGNALRITHYRLLFMGIALAATVCAADAASPNIVYVLADDMGYGDVGACYADGKIPTPNIDRLGREGIRFTDAHTNSSVCTPTRYGILTGRYCWRTQKKSGVLHGHSSHLIDPMRETVASFLKKRGYATACIGKWHLGMDWTSKDGQKVNESNGKNVDFSQPIANGPLDVGFDYYFGISASLNHAPHAYVENRKVLGKLAWVEGKAARKKRNINGKDGWVADSYEQDDVLTTFTKKTVDWIRQHKLKTTQQPFFVYMPLSAPHAPIVPSKRFQGKSKLSEYGDYCMEVDWVVGQLLSALDKLDVADNTLVIFTSDNGPSPQAKLERLQALGHFPSGKFRGLKGSLWEAGHRVPFLARWPATVKAGTTSDQVICTTDLLATLADLHDAKLPDDAGEDSVSFLPALKGKTIPDNARRGIVHHSDSGLFAIRRGNWKVVFDKAGGTRRNNPKDRPVKNPADIQLFDMRHDSVESTNLQRERPEVVKELAILLNKYITEGRSTPGARQKNEPGKRWSQIDVITAAAGFSSDAQMREGEGVPLSYTEWGGFQPDRMVDYKDHPKRPLRLHVFEPPGFQAGDSRPAIVLFFGGGWSGTNTRQFYAQAEYLASRGMVAICATYRATNAYKTKPFHCVEDGKSAIRYVRAHAEALGVDPDKVAAGGGSAGGHIAAATATVKAWDSPDDDLSVSAIPNALVLFNPVYANGPGGYGNNDKDDRVSAYWKKISPLHNLDGKQPPTLVLMGSRDKHTSVQTTQLYDQKMEANGNRCETIIYEGQKHGFFNLQKGGKEYFLKTLIAADKFLASLGFLEGEPTAKKWFAVQEKK